MEIDEYFEQFAAIVGREGNVPLAAVYTLSQLNKWFFDNLNPLLKKYRAIYGKFAPRLARAQHRKLLAQPVEYNGTAVRILSILDTQGYLGGIRLLSSNQPLFSDDFLSTRLPALTNICLVLNKPVEFFYKIGIDRRGILRSGCVCSSNYTALPPRTSEEIESARQEMEDPEYIDAILPGRYFVDLNLDLDINPILFGADAFYTDDVLFSAAYSLMWYDVGCQMEPTLVPDLRVIIDNITHIIAQFKTTTDINDAQDLVINCKDVRKYPLVGKMKPVAEELNTPSIVKLSADTLLADD